MASCFCIRKLQDLVRSLMPVLSVRVAIPPLAQKLATLSQALTPSAGSSSASMASSASFAASLPPLPIHPLLVARLAENFAAAAQINSALGVNVASSSSASQVRMSLQSLSTHMSMVMAAIQIPPQQLAALLNLTSTLASMTQFQSSFGINLLAPTASAQIRAALQARVAPPAPAPASATQANATATLAAYAQMAAAAQAAGGASNLIPSAQAMASIQLPQPSPLLISQLSTLMTLQQMSSQIQSALGLNPMAANLSASVRAALQPLPPMVESLTANLAAGSAASAAPVSANAAAQISALASMNLRALAKLQIPNLAPLRLVAQFAATSAVTSASRCGPDCPVSF
jgi:hypothetical protein